MRILLGVLCVFGCGRMEFDALRDAEATPSDSALSTCVSGARLSPVAALNTSLSDPADACDIDSVLVRDTLTTGLDRGLANCPATWDPNGSCGCVAVDLGAHYAIASVSVWEAPVAQACGTACTGVECGTGHSFSVFAAADLAAPVMLESLTYDGTALNETVVPVTQTARYVMVCRQSWSRTRDDIAVDYIDAVCQ